MKLFSRLPVLLRVVLFFGICEFFVFLTFVITGLISVKGPVVANLIIVILVLLLTYVLLTAEGLTWADAGLSMRPAGLKQLFAGSLGGMLMLVAVAGTIRLIIGYHWLTDPSFSWWGLPAIFVSVFCSAFAQEVAFRGYPFFLMWRKWGEWPAQLVTAFSFGCMHLHEGMHWRDIALTMFSTGIGSLLFGMATIRTGRLYLAVGIHFGWNFLQYLLPRSLGENGHGIWQVAGGEVTSVGLLAYMAPYVVFAGIAYCIIRISQVKMN